MTFKVLAFHGREVGRNFLEELDGYDFDEMQDDWGGVAIYLGETLVTVITRDDLVIHHCDVDIEETVARWLAGKLA